MKIEDNRIKMKPTDLFRGDVIRFKVSGAYYMLVKDLKSGKYALLDLQNGEIGDVFVKNLDELFNNYNEIDEVYRDREIKMVLD